LTRFGFTFANRSAFRANFDLFANFLQGFSKYGDTSGHDAADPARLSAQISLIRWWPQQHRRTNRRASGW